MSMNPQSFASYFEDPENREARSWAYEELHRINDLCDDRTAFLVRAYTEQGIRFGPQEALAEMGLRLYLDETSAFESAWSNFVLFRSTASLSSHRLPPGLTITSDAIAQFQRSVRDFFAAQAKGQECEVVPTDTERGVVLRIDHGTYMKTYPHWRDEQVRFLTLRPAKEDVLHYETEAGLVHIRAAIAKDRDANLRFIARDIAGDEGLVDAAALQPVLTLAPISYGTFGYHGDGQEVIKVDLYCIRMRVYGRTVPMVTIVSDDICESLASDIRGLSLESGDLLEARLRFHLLPKGGRLVKVTATVRPPSLTKCSRTNYSQLIERYLEDQGVRVR
jgi:hypothetical protein